MTSTVTTHGVSANQDAARTTMVCLSSPITAADVQTAWPALQRALTAQFDDFAARDAEALLAFCESVQAQGGHGWMVKFDGVPVGCIVLSPMTQVASSLIVLLDFNQDTELNREAVEIALLEAFVERKVLEHICCTVFLEGVPNVSYSVVLSELGARHQGVLRNQTLRAGALTDVYLMGFLRAEFLTETRSAHGR